MAFTPCTTCAIVRPFPQLQEDHHRHSFLCNYTLPIDLIASLFRILAPFVHAAITTAPSSPQGDRRAHKVHWPRRQKMCCPPSSLRCPDVSPHRSQRRTVRFPVLERLVSGDIASVSACGLAILGPRWTDVMATAPCTPTTNHCRTDQLPHRRKHQSFVLNATRALHASTSHLNNPSVPASDFPRTATQHRSEPKDGDPVSA